MDLGIFFVAFVILLFTIIRVLRIKKNLVIEDFYQNDRLLATYLIWTFVNLFLFFTSDGSHDEDFYPGDYHYNKFDSYDAQELLVYIVGPLVLVYIFQLIKRNRVPGEK